MDSTTCPAEWTIPCANLLRLRVVPNNYRGTLRLVRASSRPTSCKPLQTVRMRRPARAVMQSTGRRDPRYRSTRRSRSYWPAQVSPLPLEGEARLRTQFLKNYEGEVSGALTLVSVSNWFARHLLRSGGRSSPDLDAGSTHRKPIHLTARARHPFVVGRVVDDQESFAVSLDSAQIPSGCSSRLVGHSKRQLGCWMLSVCRGLH